MFLEEAQGAVLARIVNFVFCGRLIKSTAVLEGDGVIQMLCLLSLDEIIWFLRHLQQVLLINISFIAC